MLSAVSISGSPTNDAFHHSILLSLSRTNPSIVGRILSRRYPRHRNSALLKSSSVTTSPFPGDDPSPVTSPRQRHARYLLSASLRRRYLCSLLSLYLLLSLSTPIFSAANHVTRKYRLIHARRDESQSSSCEDLGPWISRGGNKRRPEGSDLSFSERVTRNVGI